jgi:chemotaxis family two-component system response regulator Rcp1
VAHKAIEILLVDDDPGDVELIREVLADMPATLTLHAVYDGVEAMAYLRREEPYATAVRPDLILLDLNMPRKDGREVLHDIKTNAALRTIPVVVLTTSDDDTDIATAYELGANCYITKPLGFLQFTEVIQRIEVFWCTTVHLPSGRKL